jgi:hypothetical protein
MTHEIPSTPAPKRPYEQYGLTEQEALYWRVSQERFRAILDDEQTLIHHIRPDANEYGEFLFVTTSRPGMKDRVCMTFYGLGYHEHRERWISQEWFWFQDNPYPNLLQQTLSKEEAREQLEQRLAEIQPQLGRNTQTAFGQLYEILADLTDEDGALAELEDMGELALVFLLQPEPEKPEMPPPTGENLLDEASREMLPRLYANEELGMDAQAQVKFFTPDSDWTWYASEFDGEDIFFGLVSGFEVELGYFSLKELQEVRGPMGLQIERDLQYEPKTLRELQEKHLSERFGGEQNPKQV